MQDPQLDQIRLFFENFAVIFILGILILFPLVTGILGSRRYNLIAKTFVDPYKEKFSTTQSSIKDLLSKNWIEYKTSKDLVHKLQKDTIDYLKKEQESLKEPPQLEFTELTIFAEDEKLEKIVFYDKRVELLNQYLKELEIDWYSQEREIKHKYYLYRDENYTKLHEMEQSWNTAVVLYDSVIEEINEAQSAVSSAETMEVVDLFSKNKGISIMSSMSNSSAQSEIDDIKPSMNRLKKHLESLQKDMNQGVTKMDVTDIGDLMTDLFFDFSFDFMSVFSLFSLSAVSSNLDSLERQLAPLGKDLRSQLSKMEDAKRKYFVALS